MAQRDIVVVGASAGGVAALQALIAGLPATFPAAVLVVLHIPPHTPSHLDTILARAGTMPVTSAQDNEPIVPGHVYVASTDRHLLVEADHLRVTRGPKENRVRPAIDALFRSAAYVFGPRVIGIVLSGMLDDGTAGAWTIKERGGMVLVQSPEDAEHPPMPESALKYVAVDYTLPVADMPAFLAQLTRRPIATAADAAPAEALRIETRIALEGNALREGIMELEAISPNTCPECHGVLVKIKEGPIVRYRCHTGHAFSLQTLRQMSTRRLKRRYGAPCGLPRKGFCCCGRWRSCPVRAVMKPSHSSVRSKRRGQSTMSGACGRRCSTIGCLVPRLC